MVEISLFYQERPVRLLEEDPWRTIRNVGLEDAVRQAGKSPGEIIICRRTVGEIRQYGGYDRPYKFINPTKEDIEDMKRWGYWRNL